jgi:hypothetical protein
MIRRYNGGFYAFATPFGGRLKEERENINAPIRRLFLLIKDRKNYLRRIFFPKSISRFLANVVKFSLIPEKLNKTFNLCCELLQKMPFYELHFLPDESFWRCLDDIN